MSFPAIPGVLSGQYQLPIKANYRLRQVRNAAGPSTQIPARLVHCEIRTGGTSVLPHFLHRNYSDVCLPPSLASPTGPTACHRNRAVRGDIAFVSRAPVASTILHAFLRPRPRSLRSPLGVRRRAMVLVPISSLRPSPRAVCARPLQQSRTTPPCGARPATAVPGTRPVPSASPSAGNGSNTNPVGPWQRAAMRADESGPARLLNPAPHSNTHPGRGRRSGSATLALQCGERGSIGPPEAAYRRIHWASPATGTTSPDPVPGSEWIFSATGASDHHPNVFFQGQLLGSVTRRPSTSTVLLKNVPPGRPRAHVVSDDGGSGVGSQQASPGGGPAESPPAS